MNSNVDFGQLNSHALGIIMKELVRRAIDAIRTQQFAFDMKTKETEGKDIDFVTSADQAAQVIYLKSLRECTPNFGIVAEEDNFRQPCQIPRRQIYWSVDPLDGTKAFIRGQSHGIGTMLALSVDGEIVAAFIGDVMTQEIYGFRPGSSNVHRISEYNHATKLEIDPELPLSQQYLLLRGRPENLSPRMQTLTLAGGAFKDIEVGGGSIGISFARLWKGEVGGLILGPARDTPWDLWPLIGISQKLGFAFLKPEVKVEGEEVRLIRYHERISLDPKSRDHDTLIIHKSRLEEVGCYWVTVQ